MSEHLDFHGLERSPFGDEAQASVVIGTRALRKVVSRIQATVRDGGARIGVLGVAGIGKTCLARALPKLLAGQARVAAILDPAEDWKSLRLALARDWQLGGGKLARAGLIGAARGRRLVLVVDRAEEAPPALLRHLEALQAIEVEPGAPVVTVVLFVRSDRDEPDERPAVLEWLEGSQAALIAYEPLSPEAVADFIERRLQHAGYRGHPLFTPRAALAIHGETNGVPGAIARLCEGLLADAAIRRLRTIDEPFVRARRDAKPTLAAITEPSAAADEDAWDDADHHPRETAEEELLLEDALPGRPRPAVHPAAHEEVDEAALGHDPELEAYLSAPPTAEELRAIRGGFVRRNLWPFAAVSAAAVLGGLLLARLTSGTPQDGTPPVAPAPHLASAGPPASSPVLGRLRGPVTAAPAAPATLARRAAPSARASSDPVVPLESPLRRAGDLDDSALPAARRAEPAPHELRDDRPQDLAPPAGIDPVIP